MLWPHIHTLVAIWRAGIEEDQDMKHLRLLPALAVMLLAVPALADAIPATLKLDEVIVNPRGAQLVRVGDVQVPAGIHEIIIDTLPADVPTATVQVEGRSTGTATIGSVDVSAVVLDPATASAGERTRIEDEIEALGRDRDRQQQTINDAQFRRQTLERLTGGGIVVSHAGGGSAPAVTPDQVSGLLGLTSKELSETSQLMLDAQAAMARIDERVGLLQRKLQQLASEPRAHTRVAIQVSAEIASTLTLSLKYSVPDAGWRPVYDARLQLPADGGKAKLELVSRAMVFQRSGEAWDDVNLKLSTAQVTGRTSAPELEPVAAGPLPPQVRYEEEQADTAVMQKRSYSTGVGNLAAAAPPVAEVRQQMAEVVNAGFHAIYSVGGRSSIPNTGAQKSVRLGSSDATPEIRIDTVPMLDAQAYLTAVFNAQGQSPMLPGEVSLFRDGVFAGKTRVKQVSPGERVELGFGRDDMVRVVRRQLDNTSGSTGIISTDTTINRLFNTQVENLHAFPVTVRLSERMPYSTHEDVVIELSRETSTPTRTDPDKRRGIVEWDLAIEAGGKTDVVFGYTVAYPSKMSVMLPDG
jgi:uncharacterized protein (TIGR02231 family)